MGKAETEQKTAPHQKNLFTLASTLIINRDTPWKGRKMINWKPIEDCRPEEFERFIGFDAGHDNGVSGICIITWLEADEDYPGTEGWDVNPIEFLAESHEGRITHFGSRNHRGSGFYT